MSRLLSAAVGAHRSYCLADILLPSREAIASVFVTRSECQSFLATCQLLAHIGHVADGLLLQHVLVIVKHPVDGLIARHPEQQGDCGLGRLCTLKANRPNVAPRVIMPTA